MIGWLINLTEEQRRTSINEAARLSGINAKAIEKDWWVTISLRALFQTKYNKHLTFKGGTSLSKGWNQIERLSEDIDISMDSEALGIAFSDKPSKSFVEKLRREGCVFTSINLVSELKNAFEIIGVPKGTISIHAEEIKDDMPDTDPQAIYINYASLFDPNPYLLDRVKIEVSVRSVKDPNSERNIQSILYQTFPNLNYLEADFPVRTVQPQRTFMEKIFLLHEEYNRQEHERMRTERMSRHYYDLFKMMNEDYALSACKDDAFIQDIIEHRKYYSRLRRFDYTTLQKGSISILPPQDLKNALASDYEIMRLQMIYGEAPSFDDLMLSMKEIEQRINTN